jgi:hypothetical protein
MEMESELGVGLPEAEKPRGGRATARKVCDVSFAVTAWRSWTEVVLYGYKKTTWTPGINIECRAD